MGDAGSCAVSIAMATYNGADYIREQLESIASQTRRPDELIVCDDGSSDETIKILERFAARAPFPIRLFRNRERLGYSNNFRQAIGCCGGEIVFLSDQDDIWHREKVEVMIDQFDQSPDLLVVVHDCLISEGGISSKQSYLDQLRSIDRAPGEHIAGWCTAFRRRLGPIVQKVDGSIVNHDTAIHAIAGGVKQRLVLPVVLGTWRRHDKTASRYVAATRRAVSLIDDVRDGLGADVVLGYSMQMNINAEIARVLNEAQGELSDGADLAQAEVRRLISFNDAIQERLELFDANFLHRTRGACRMLASGAYHAYFRGWKSFVKDVVFR